MRLVKSWDALLAWLQFRPAEIEGRTARIYAMARASFPFTVITHFVLCVVFYQLGLQVLFLFNIGSTILWAFIVWRVFWHGRIVVPFILGTFVEVPLHAVLATYYTGIETGFFLYILLTILTAVLLPFFSRPIRLTISCFFMLVLAFSCAYSIHYGPAIPISRQLNTIFFAINGIFLPALIASVMALYEWIAERAEVDLIDSHERAEAANEKLKNVSSQLSKYISPQLYETILSGEQTVKVESHRKKLTVFFSDIVGFTETTDQLQSEELTSLLNEYLTEMSLIAQRHGANFDKFIGDSILLYFGDPDTKGAKADAVSCVRMAFEMQSKMNDLQSNWRGRGLDRPFQIRIGINTGYCTIGNFGSEDRMDYTIIGGEVNLAARLESLAEPGEILLANETYQLVKDSVVANEGETIQVKGISRPVVTYRVSGLSEEEDSKQNIHIDEPALSLIIDQSRMDATARQAAVTKLRKAISELESTP